MRVADGSTCLLWDVYCFQIGEPVAFKRWLNYSDNLKQQTRNDKSPLWCKRDIDCDPGPCISHWCG